MPDIGEIFRATSDALSSDFGLARLITHAGESGRVTEEALKALLKKHMPSRFDVVSGLAMGAGGKLSRQCDLLVIDALNCPRLLQTGGAGLYPADGAVGLVEVTQHLSATKRKDDFEKIRQFRTLPTSFWYAPDFRDRGPLAFIFAEKSEPSLAANGQGLTDQWRRTPADAKHSLPNGIVILDAGIVLYGDGKGIHCD